MDINYQITTKYATVAKPKLFHQLNTPFVDWWSAEHKRLTKPQRKCFHSMVILTSWHLWKERTRRTFDQRVHTITDMVALTSDEIVCWCQAGFRHLAPVAAAFGRLVGREIVQV